MGWTSRFSKILVLAIMLSLVLPPATGTDSPTTDSLLPQVSGDKGNKPNIFAPTGSAPTSLLKKDIFLGSGKEVLAVSRAATSDGSAQVLETHYMLMAWSTGRIIESSWDKEKSVTFGLINVIEGWQQGMPGMKEGGRRLLVIPPALGYGETGSGPIGPNETMIFVIDLVAINPAPKPTPEPSPKFTPTPTPTPTPTYVADEEVEYDGVEEASFATLEVVMRPDGKYRITVTSNIASDNLVITATKKRSKSILYRINTNNLGRASTITSRKLSGFTLTLRYNSEYMDQTQVK
jgi:peptidylprolyl isomerase